MDKQDILLSLMLLGDSRTTFRTLAERLNLSINAVHKRIQSQISGNVIRRFTARPTLYALNAVQAIVFGRTDGEISEDTVKALGKEEHTYWVGLAGGGQLYVGGYLRDISELEHYINFVSATTGMQAPTVGILSHSVVSPQASGDQPKLSEVDLRIINALRNDSRRPISEVAKELGLSAKTVQKHIDSMFDAYLVEFSMDWYPDTEDDIVSMLHIQLAPSADRNKVVAFLTNKYFPRIMVHFPFNNLPQTILSMTWSNNMRDLKELRESVQKESGIKSVTTNILFTGYLFDTWRDELAAAKTKRH